MTYPDRTLERETVERMVRTVEPNARLRDHRLLDGGYLSTHRVAVETDEGTRECVLKASTGEDDHGVALEARVLAIVREHTPVPVPAVLGAVDDHEDLPAPFFLMAAMPGTSVPRTEIDDLSDATLERIARGTGRHLAALHAIEAVDAFGFLRPAPGRTLQGGRPSGAVSGIEVVDPADSWRAFLRDSAEGVLDALSDGRFGDLVADVRPAIDDRIDGLSGPFDPALAHIDNSLENVLVDPGTGAVTAMLDWAFTLAVTPAYDLAFVVHSFSGGPWWFAPSTPDRKSLVRESLLAGYRERAPERVVEQYRANRECYELLATLHSTLHFADRLAFDGATDEEIEGAARRHREVLAGYL